MDNSCHSENRLCYTKDEYEQLLIKIDWLEELLRAFKGADKENEQLKEDKDSYIRQLKKQIASWGRKFDNLLTIVEQIQAKNEQLKKAIEDFGNNPAGFDWGVLDKIDDLENLLIAISSFMKHLGQSEYAETAMEYQASIERALGE